MKLSVIIPTYNRKNSLIRTLDGLSRQHYPFTDFEAIVVSDGSTDGTEEMLAKYAQTSPYSLRVVRQPNGGPSKARNRGIKEAQHEVVVFLDDDVEPLPEFLQCHAHHHQHDEKIAVVGPMSPDPERSGEEPVWIAWEHAKLQEVYEMFRHGGPLAGYPASAVHFYSGNASVRKKWLLAVDGFDERYTRQEDVELAVRMRQICGIGFRFDFAANGLHRPQRTFKAWLRIPTAYGAFDAQRINAGLLRWADVEKNARKRNAATQTLAALCLTFPFLLPVCVILLHRSSLALYRIGNRTAALAALSALYNVCYIHAANRPEATVAEDKQSCSPAKPVNSNVLTRLSAADVPAGTAAKGVPRAGARRIVVGNGSLGMQNYGDVAMLKVAVNRLQHIWPDAIIYVVTDRPDRLKYHCPEAQPISTCGNLVSKLCRIIPFLAPLLHRWPFAHMLLLKLNKFINKSSSFVRSDLEDLIRHADLVVASGGGYMNDLFAYNAYMILEMLDTAHKFDIPNALLGQGLGPIKQGPFYNRCLAVLPKLNMIAIRESVAAPPLLKSLCVASEKVIATGDDAVELAYQARKPVFGDGIGVNLRMMAYAMADESILCQVREVLHKSASKYQAPLIPAPISMSKNERDWETISRLIEGPGVHSDGGRHLKTPKQVIEQVGQCRIVVTGSYHAAVFALAQGIPAVCLAKSNYYFEKFGGLLEQFGTGCTIVSMDGDLTISLEEAIDKAWASAETVRPLLLAAAEHQINVGWNAYERLMKRAEAKLGAGATRKARNYADK
jgi:polysaccharide pyruvyl transferase WcaK-like protein